MFYLRKFKSKYDLGSSSFAHKDSILWMRSLNMINLKKKRCAPVFIDFHFLKPPYIGYICLFCVWCLNLVDVYWEVLDWKVSQWQLSRKIWYLWNIWFSGFFNSLKTHKKFKAYQINSKRKKKENAITYIFF